MIGIRNIFGRRRGKFSVNPRRPVSGLVKSIYLMALISTVAVLVVMAISIQMNGETGKIAGGIGFVFLVTELLLTGLCITRIRDDSEPISARIISTIVSVLAFGIWLSVYILGVVAE